ncbi:MAG: hypothetical protein AAFO69_02345, partial [Bacteroidota bacterium]
TAVWSSVVCSLRSVRVTSDGNVGIGTTMPRGSLDVNGATYSQAQFVSVNLINVDYTVLDTDYHIVLDGTVGGNSLTLPPPSTESIGRKLEVSIVGGGNTWTLQPGVGILNYEGQNVANISMGANVGNVASLVLVQVNSTDWVVISRILGQSI